jgi:hypothetical protein
MDGIVGRLLEVNEPDLLSFENVRADGFKVISEVIIVFNFIAAPETLVVFLFFSGRFFLEGAVRPEQSTSLVCLLAVVLDSPQAGLVESLDDLHGLVILTLDNRLLNCVLQHVVERLELLSLSFSPLTESQSLPVAHTRSHNARVGDLFLVKALLDVLHMSGSMR